MFPVQKALSEIAHGDSAAEEFIRAFYLFAHTLDDLIDRDKPLPAEEAVWMQFNLISTVAGNPFFVKHREFLMPVILMSSLAYLASEDRKNALDPLQRIEAQILKSQWGDVLFAAAFLTGGFGHALAMSRKYREFSYDAEPPKELAKEA